MEDIGSKLDALKIIHDGLLRDFRQLKKAARQSEPVKKRKKKTNEESPGQAGFVISKELALFLGLTKGERIGRDKATKDIVSYIRKHSLSAGKVIKPDAKLLTILDIEQVTELTFFNIQSCISHNFIRANPKSAVRNELVTKDS